MPFCSEVTQHADSHREVLQGPSASWGYWSAIHCFRMETSPCCRNHSFARDVAGLDFVAFTPHEDYPVKLTQAAREMADEACASYHATGTFLTRLRSLAGRAHFGRQDAGATMQRWKTYVRALSR